MQTTLPVVSAKDGTRAFMTGEFNEDGLIDDVEGLTYTELLELEDWIKFYDKSYVYKGIVNTCWKYKLFVLYERRQDVNK